MPINQTTDEKTKIDVNISNLQIKEFSAELNKFNNKIVSKTEASAPRELLAKQVFDLKIAGNDFQYSRNEKVGEKSNQPYSQAQGLTYWVGEIEKSATTIQNKSGQYIDAKTAKEIEQNFKDVGEKLGTITANIKNNTENFGKGNDYKVIGTDPNEQKTQAILDKTKPSMSLQNELTFLIEKANKIKELSQKVEREATLDQAPATPKKAPKAKSRPAKKTEEKKSVATPSKESKIEPKPKLRVSKSVRKLSTRVAKGVKLSPSKKSPANKNNKTTELKNSNNKTPNVDAELKKINQEWKNPAALTKARSNAQAPKRQTPDVKQEPNRGFNIKPKAQAPTAAGKPPATTTVTPKTQTQGAGQSSNTTRTDPTAKLQEQAYKNAPYLLKTTSTPKPQAPSKNLIASLEPIEPRTRGKAPQKQTKGAAVRQGQAGRSQTPQSQTKGVSARQGPSTVQPASRQPASQVRTNAAPVRQGQVSRQSSPQASGARAPNVETRIQNVRNQRQVPATQAMPNTRPSNTKAPVSKAMSQAINNKRNAPPFPPKVADLATQATKGVKSLQVSANQPRSNQPQSPGITKMPPTSNKRQV